MMIPPVYDGGNEKIARGGRILLRISCSNTQLSASSAQFVSDFQGILPKALRPKGSWTPTSLTPPSHSKLIVQRISFSSPIAPA